MLHLGTEEKCFKMLHWGTGLFHQKNDEKRQSLFIKLIKKLAKIWEICYHFIGGALF